MNQFTSEMNTVMSGTCCWNDYPNSDPMYDIKSARESMKLPVRKVHIKMTSDVHKILLKHPSIHRWLKNMLNDKVEIIEGDNRFKLYKKGTEEHYDMIPLDLNIPDNVH